MKAYEFKKPQPEFTYPEDMKIIMYYLQIHGKLRVDAKTVETLYGEYCDECWAAGWLGVDMSSEGGISNLECFAQWLSKYDI